ncbi:hypothetical protein DID73_01370 [Candidatus Marinamargulisbacteria bacterium SCGC AG-343-K17]|nr:hypothetical protein DID73_01370 [Candidatus Marinamargulisbacteria bacterium SCGC AG-343-K17]
MKKYILGLLCFLLVGCSSSDPKGSFSTTGRGTVKSFSDLPTLSCTDGSNMLIKSYKLIYETVGIDGESKVQASAAVLVPANILGGNGNATTLLYLHGTIFKRSDAPSQFTTSNITPLELAPDSACNSLVTVVPDYLGLGEDTTQMHPHSHAKSLATASVDALKAAQEFLKGELGITINKSNIIISGFSEGAYATMVTHREIQENHASDFIVKASYPLAGAYDLSDTMYNALFKSNTPYVDIMSNGQPLTGVSFVPYIILTYMRTNNITDSVSDIFISGLSDIETKYDMNTSMADITTYINNALPSGKDNILKEMINSDYNTAIDNDSNHPIRKALVENDAYKWKPETKMLIIACDGDDITPSTNATVAHNYMTNTLGSTVVSKQIVSADSHADCLMPGAQAIMTDLTNLLSPSSPMKVYSTQIVK